MRSRARLLLASVTPAGVILAGVMLAGVMLAVGGCSGSGDWAHLLGQTLYNFGHYSCTQADNCETAGERPGSTSNRR